jgi:hypothetical protein
MTAQLNYSPEYLEAFLNKFGYSVRALRSGEWQPISLSGFSSPEDLPAIPPCISQISRRTEVATVAACPAKLQAVPLISLLPLIKSGLVRRVPFR